MWVRLPPRPFNLNCKSQGRRVPAICVCSYDVGSVSSGRAGLAVRSGHPVPRPEIHNDLGGHPCPPVAPTASRFAPCYRGGATLAAEPLVACSLRHTQTLRVGGPVPALRSRGHPGHGSIGREFLMCGRRSACCVTAGVRTAPKPGRRSLHRGPNRRSEGCCASVQRASSAGHRFTDLHPGPEGVQVFFPTAEFPGTPVSRRRINRLLQGDPLDSSISVHVKTTRPPPAERASISAAIQPGGDVQFRGCMTRRGKTPCNR